MKFVTAKEYKINTVHIRDVSKALIHVSKWFIDSDLKGTEVFNLADKGNTGKMKYTFLDQKIMGDILEELFNIKVNSLNSIVLALLKVKTSFIVV